MYLNSFSLHSGDMFTKNPHGINPHARRTPTVTSTLRFASDEALTTFQSTFSQVLGIEELRHLGDGIYEVQSHIPIPKKIRDRYCLELSPVAASY